MNDISLGLQTAFVVFFGPPLAFFMGVAIFGAICESLIRFVADDAQRVEIASKNDDA